MSSQVQALPGTSHYNSKSGPILYVCILQFNPGKCTVKYDLGVWVFKNTKENARA